MDIRYTAERVRRKPNAAQMHKPGFEERAEEAGGGFFHVEAKKRPDAQEGV